MNERTSVAMTEELDRLLRNHLTRDDGQEDLCFALYKPSQGATRFSALLVEAIMPSEGDRNVHCNVSFNPQFFDGVLSKAISMNCGVALLHSHPGARSWQGMSQDDEAAESGMAASLRAATGLPLVGLTLSTASGHWSGRVWRRNNSKHWRAIDCENVRVVGSRLTAWACPGQKRFPLGVEALRRTIHAWGENAQRRLAELRIGIVGLGSVGSLVAEELARMGFREMIGIDFDILKDHNRDRTVHAYPESVEIEERKVSLSARSCIRSATMPSFAYKPVPMGIHELTAYREALDCDVLFSCVDRPWPRSILNHLSYANLIPVIDGGIGVFRKPDGSLRSAEWGVFVVGPGRKCLECSEQYNSGHVALEMAGDLDDPTYIESLPEDSPLKQGENVFAFSMALAAAEVLKLIQLVEAPAGMTAPMSERMIYPSGTLAIDRIGRCSPNCEIPRLTALGENAGHPGTREFPGDHANFF